MTTMNRSERVGLRWPEDLGQDLRDAGRNVLLAGLGAVGTLDERGRELVSELVERGRRLAEDRPAFDQRLREEGEKLWKLGRDAEHRLEQRMSTTLQRFGVPSREDVKILSDRIEELTRKVESLSATN